MTTISMKVAHRIWTAHREIEVAEKMLADIASEWPNREAATPVDPRGKGKTFQLGIPSGDGHRLLFVSGHLAKYVIEAHVADMRKELAEASIAARMELDGVVS